MIEVHSAIELFEGPVCCLDANENYTFQAPQTNKSTSVRAPNAVSPGRGPTAAAAPGSGG